MSDLPHQSSTPAEPRLSATAAESSDVGQHADPAAYPGAVVGADQGQQLDSLPEGRQAPDVSRFAAVPLRQPYHLLARNSSYRWWRPLVALLVLAVTFVIFTVTALAVLVIGYLLSRAGSGASPRGALEGVLDDRMYMLVVGFGSLVVLLPAVWLTVRITQRRPMSSVSSVDGRLRWSWLGECLLAGFLGLGAVFGLGLGYEAFVGKPFAGFPGWETYGLIAAIALLLVPLQSAAEEYAFRGLLVQTVASWFRSPWIAILLASVLFLLGHGYTDPLVWTQLMVMALAMCWLTVRTGGLEAAIGLHVANNVLSLLVAGLSGVPTLDQAGDYAMIDVVPFLLAIPLYAWYVDRRAERRQLNTGIGARPRISPWSLTVVR